MKNLLLGLSMVAIILAGVLAGCLATNAILGENPFQLIQRWREEDAGKLSSDAGNLEDEKGEDDSQSRDPEETEGDPTGAETGKVDSSTAQGAVDAPEQTPVDPPTQSPEPLEQNTDTKANTYTPPVSASNNAGTLGDYYVEIKSASVAKDHEGNPAIIITYAWTNNSEETKRADLAVMGKAFQDGVQLDTAIIGDSSIYDAMLTTKEIRPGITLDVQDAYELTSETSVVEFEVSELFGMSKENVSMNFDLTSIN